MLSVCIPIFNQDVGRLTQQLHEQAMSLGVEAEILLLDDASEEGIMNANRQLSGLPLVRYEELKTNVGRSRIRNILSEKARYPLLLYLDCDVNIIANDFLKQYLQAGKDGSVVCGGHVYQPSKASHPYLLHWLAGSKRETRNCHSRQKKQYHSFMTSSFLVPASLIYQLPFNEELNGYGHEDTLYGYQLMKRNIPIKHIDNPVMHEGLENARDYLEKMQSSMHNLRQVYRLTGYDLDFCKMVKVLRLCEQLRKHKLDKPFRIIYRLLRKSLQKNLLGTRPRLWVLDLYKLGHICSTQAT